MRISYGFCLLMTFCAAPALAQHPEPLLGGGVYLAGGPGTGNVGVYAEMPRYRFRPGVEVREDVQGSGYVATLGGPRASFVVQNVSFYAAGLFGPSHITVEPTPTTSQVLHGVTSEIAVGVELGIGPVFRWRMVEYSRGLSSGLGGIEPHEISTGIVLHFH